MTHDEVVGAIQVRAAARGILSHYCPRSERCRGDRGMPDLVLVGQDCVVWIEVKTSGDRLKPDQTRWRYALLAAGEVCEVMHAADLAAGGAVDMILSFAAAGNVA